MLGESAIYGLGGVANQALGIVLVPIYARQLGVADYGTVAILTTTLSLTSMVVTLGLPQAFFRSYLKEARGAAEQRSILETSLTLRLLVSFVGLLLMAALAYPLAAVLLGSGAHWGLMAVIGGVVFFDSMNLVPLSLLRAQRRPIPYATLSFIRAVWGSVLIVLFVVWLELGVGGVVLGSLISAITAASLGLLLLAREGRLRLGLDAGLTRHMLSFGVPLVPASIAGWTLNLSDRYIVQAFEGRTAVGLYSSGYTVGLAINALAIAPFALAWGATYWEIARHPDARQTIGRTLHGLVAMGSFMALGVSALATDLFRVLLTPAFEDGRFVTPFSAFAYVLYGCYTVFTTGLNLENQTKRIPIIVGTVAAINVAINLALVPRVGYMGAAVSTLFSYGLLAAIAAVVGQRHYPVDWDLWRVAPLFGLALLLSGAALLGPDLLLWRLAMIAVYPIVGVGTGLIPRSMVRSLVELVSGRGSRV